MSNHVVKERGLRADGSPRKPVKIRAGYTQPHLVKKYKPKGVRLREEAEQKKREEMEKEAANISQNELPICADTPVKIEMNKKVDQVVNKQDEQEDQNKQLKRLQKKMKQTTELKQKVDTGEVIPNEDQIVKIGQLASLQSQIEDLTLARLERLSLNK